MFQKGRTSFYAGKSISILIMLASFFTKVSGSERVNMIYLYTDGNLYMRLPSGGR